MERTCHRDGCGRATFVFFERMAWCHGHFLKRVATSDAERERAQSLLADQQL